MKTIERGTRRIPYEKRTVTLLLTAEQREQIDRYFEANPKIKRSHWLTEACLEKLERESQEQSA